MKQIEKITFVSIGFFALMFIIPSLHGKDLWEFTDKLLGKGASDYLNYFFGAVFITALVYTVIRVINATKNTINEFKDNNN
jgi:hypothetical protein